MSYTYRSSGASSRNKSYSNRGSGRSNNRNRGGGKTEYIDIKRFVSVASAEEEIAYVATNKFTDFELGDLLQANLKAKGYLIPSPIQDQSIAAGIAGKDIIGVASTGTGKTAAFGLPVLRRLIRENDTYALVIAPTRELAQQIQVEFNALARGSNSRSALLIGGTNIGGQLRDLRNNPHLVIGTPGRIKDHMQRNTLKINRFNIVVLDEVDRMLDMGFVNDVTSILSETQVNKQSYFFSATLNPSIRNLIDTFTKDPLTVVHKASSASNNVHQDVVRYEGNSDRLNKLGEILARQDVGKVLVFDETQRGVERLSQDLAARGFSTESLHGGKSQGQRQRALAKFKQNEIKVLVATDVAARGIDVANITHVVNYSIPKVYDDYIHRIGRAGRAGKTGYALTFVAS
jgi:ATP-dependent RNA helicase RhlE